MIWLREGAVGLAAAALAVALVGGASAQTQPAPSTETATPAVAPAPRPATKTARNNYDPNQVICEWIEETGSRLDNRKVCLTRFQWDQQSDDARDKLNDYSGRQVDQKGWGN